jgi:hypothetical protein
LTYAPMKSLKANLGFLSPGGLNLAHHLIVEALE